MEKNDIGITRENALKLLKQYIKNENTIRHCLATEVVMRELASKFEEDVDAWGIAGLLHDLDLEVINNDLKVHGIKTEKILNDLGINPIITRSIRMHNEEASKEKRTDRFHIALAAGETITGLIVATTLVYPDKKIKSVKSKSIVKRMKEKAFAASVNREIIRECEKIDIPLNEFAKLSLDAMCTIDNEIGL